MNIEKRIKFAAYVYPAWHPSAYRRSLGRKWSEWELVKTAKPLFSGHKVVEQPLWGYYNDSNPVFVKRQIETALKHHIDIFVFSYYWNNKPVLNEGIDRGFLQAENNKQIQFALLLSPRLPRINLPLPLREPDNFDRAKREIEINEATLLRFISFVRDRYFCKDNYLKINNEPVLYFFQYYKFVEALGGATKTKALFEKIDCLLKESGFGGLYPVGTSDYLTFTDKMVKTGFKALTSYNLLGNYQSGKPIQDYSEMAKRRCREWNLYLKKATVPYLPSVSLGFDASCRGERKLPLPNKLDGGRYYPWYPIITNFSIKTFRRTLEKAVEFIKANKIYPPIIHISSWNEWSEGNHLEPGKTSKFSHLEAVKNVYKTVSTGCN